MLQKSLKLIIFSIIKRFSNRIYIHRINKNKVSRKRSLISIHAWIRLLLKMLMIKNYYI